MRLILVFVIAISTLRNLSKKSLVDDINTLKIWIIILNNKGWDAVV